MKKIQLLDFAGTTPSIEISDEIKKVFHGFNLYAGVAHVRIKVREIINDYELFEAFKTILTQKRKRLQRDVLYLLNEARERCQRGDVYLHEDIYLMMLYFFNPKDGKIMAISDVFYPASYGAGDDDSNFLLFFPVGLMFDDENIIITYGEGDIYQKLMIFSPENLKIHDVRKLEDFGISKVRCFNESKRELKTPASRLLMTL